MPYEPEPVDELDPVCGMEVDPDQARDLGLEVEHAGQKLVFCSVTCRDTFKNDPARYAPGEDARTPRA